jgi:hypothetical protein
MIDDDPNEAYVVVPTEPGPNGLPKGWWTVKTKRDCSETLSRQGKSSAIRDRSGIQSAPSPPEGEAQMTGPRPAGRPWTLTDDDMLRKLLGSGMKPRLIAQKMKRSIGAIQTRISLLKKSRERQESGRPVEPGPKAKK